jgi:hypothetical protein
MPILISFKDDWTPVAETSSDEMEMGAMRGLCQFSQLVSQPCNSDQSHEALDDVLKRFYQRKGRYQEQTMWNSAKTKVDDVLAAESSQLYEKRFIRFVLQWTRLLMGLKRFPQQNAGNFKFASIESRMKPLLG